MPPFPSSTLQHQRWLADRVFGSGKQLGPVVAYITIRMADRSKTSTTYPTRGQARPYTCLRRFRAHADTRTRERASTPRRVSSRPRASSPPSTYVTTYKFIKRNKPDQSLETWQLFGIGTSSPITRLAFVRKSATLECTSLP